EVLVVDALSLSEPKSKLLHTALRGLTGGRSCIVVVEKIDRNLALASRNIEGVEVTTSGSLSTYQVLRYPLMLVAKPALAGLEQRLRK
ncbi:MAG: 50S ribosomal protein L4, partial [Lentisphaerota bacterium]